MSINVLVTGKICLSRHLALLEENGYAIDVYTECFGEDALVDALVGKDAYILGGLEIATRKVVERTKGLKIIAVMGAGYQSLVDVEAATRKGIVITNTPNTNARAVAEMTLGLMLSLRRKLSSINHLTKAGTWREDIVSNNVYGNVLGIIGMGAIGSLVAEMAYRGFGMRILYHSRSAKRGVEERVGAQKVPLDQLLRLSDVISLHCPIIPETMDLIGEHEIRLLKKRAVLINTARPDVVNPNALSRALRAGRIAGCAMDGYYIEPAPKPAQDPYGLLKLPDDIFLLTSHVAYLTEDSIQRMSECATTSIMNVLGGKDDKHIVNPEYKRFKKNQSQCYHAVID